MRIAYIIIYMAGESVQKIGRYELIERIARGGTAEVWRAVLSGSVGFKKTVAIKRLLNSIKNSPEMRDMLIDEAKVLTHLHHRAVVQVFELCEEESEPFFAMEFVDGVDCAQLLSRLMREKSARRVDIALFIAAEALSALGFAHRLASAEGTPLHMVHRDVSPSNVLLSWSGEVKLTDFGIAKGAHRASGTMAGSLRGKLSYMSPEQASGVQVDERSDLYSLGIVLAELLLGMKLFEAGSDVELLEKVRQPPPLPAAASKLPACVRAILISALAPRLSIRYQSAAEMLSAIRSAEQKLRLAATSVELAEYLKQLFPERFLRQRQASGAEDTGEFQSDAQASQTAIFKEPLRLHLKTKHRIFSSATKLLLSAFLFGSLSMYAPPRDGGAVSRTNSPTRAVTSEQAPLQPEKIKPRSSAKKPASAKLTARISPSAREKSIGERQTQGCVKVIAEPWGVVSVEGLARDRETPAIICGQEGSYSISIRHAANGKALTQKIFLADSRNINCRATFGVNSNLRCR